MELKILAVVMAVAVVAMSAAPARGQAVAASCTASLITSFTPCFNYITNSSNGGGGGSPTADCCQSVAAMINTSTSCACLVLTGNVPLGIPINRTLAITLPKACNSIYINSDSIRRSTRCSLTRHATTATKPTGVNGLGRSADDVIAGGADDHRDAAGDQPDADEASGGAQLGMEDQCPCACVSAAASCHAILKSELLIRDSEYRWVD
uniref:Bifunctional inhibitor/plant lipid transfer protein/seed storage helical domain-containing protein n=1 Tax=Leersia perrieri TaxID=77586 RepID=A0A0D9WW33_9ORYZ